MSHELYKRYRPKAFKQVIGQDEATSQLLSMSKANRIPHCLMFVGDSGCGKTTLARIVATKLGCGGRDLVEINAAKSRGIDDIRNIESRMSSAPLFGKTRVWIIDEAHKLTNDAQNAVLKMLEDPPDHVYFSLCTTVSGKLLDTIHTRATIIPVKPLSAKNMELLLRTVMEKESIKITDEVVERIVEAAYGSPRKGLVLLDQIMQLDTEEKQLAAVLKTDLRKKAFDLVKALLYEKPVWTNIVAVLTGIGMGKKQALDEGKKNAKGEDNSDQIENPEQLRHLVLACATTEVLKGGKNAMRAYNIINCFRDPYYDCGKAGLIASCWEVCFPDG